MFLRFALVLGLLASTQPLRAADLPTLKRPIAGGSIDSVPSLTVNGEAEESIKPDYALLVLEASDERPTAAAAAVENTRQTQALLAMLNKFALSGADVEAGDLVIAPQYSERKIPHSEDTQRVLTGYRASTSYRVQIRDLDAAPRIARQIVESDGKVYSSMTFQIRENVERLAALQDKALQNAVANAQHFAKVASVELGDMLRVAPVFSGALIGAQSSRGVAESFSVPARAKDVRVHAGVTVTWELKSPTAECTDQTKAK
jgi:uncharacterized protein YggE